MRTNLVMIILCGIVLAGFVAENRALFNVPGGWPQPEYKFSGNPLTPEKVALGRALFYDPILSANNQVSCASCHSPYNAFSHVDHNLSHGINDKIGTRNAPALMNLAWNKSFMWDGAINHLDMQSLAPISHPDEMGESLANIVNKLQQSGYYPRLYLEAWGDSIITGTNTLKAISQFMLTLVSAESKYDSVMRREAVFTEQERRGYHLFQKNCGSCHTEPLFTNGKFENNGLPVDTLLRDTGRMKVTNVKFDSLKFKTPTLRNIEFSYPYMHDGRFRRLTEVVQHYTSGIQYHSTLSKSLQQPVQLSSDEKVDLVAFLLTLTDKKFLFNPNHAYPRSPLSRTSQSHSLQPETN